VLVFAVSILIVWEASDTLTLFLFAILFAYFLEPLVARLDRPLGGRGRAVGAVYFGLGIVVVVLAVIFGPRVATQARDLITTLPSLADRIGTGQIVLDFAKTHHWNWLRAEQVQEFLASHRTQIMGYASVIGERLASPVQHIWWLVLIPILSLFFLLDGKEMAKEIVQMGRSRAQRNIFHGLMYDVNVMLGTYIRAQITLASLTLVAYTLVLSLMRVPYALFLGPLCGCLEFIPVVGAAAGVAAVVIIAVLAGYPHAVWLVVFLSSWRLVQDYVNAPRIMGKSMEINPLTQIFAVLAGGEIGGIVGALISVPVLATLRIIWRRVRDAREFAAREAAGGTVG
jgi:predicted PurR-regulated permease PerM